MKCAVIFAAFFAVAYGFDYGYNNFFASSPTLVPDKVASAPQQQYEDLPDLIGDDSDEEFDEPRTPMPEPFYP